MGRWKGAYAGMAAAVAAVWAMDTLGGMLRPKLMKAETKVKSELEDEPESEVEPGIGPEDYHDISLIGRQYEKGEVATEALGRHIYRFISGKDPKTEELRQMLSNAVHWEYGLQAGCLYGWLHANGKLGPSTGLRWGVLLWLFGDELAVPLLGLQPGPKGASIGGHVNRLGLHLIYGAVLGLLTPVIKKLLPFS